LAGPTKEKSTLVPGGAIAVEQTKPEPPAGCPADADYRLRGFRALIHVDTTVTPEQLEWVVQQLCITGSPVRDAYELVATVVDSGLKITSPDQVLTLVTMARNAHDRNSYRRYQP
jgi:hypothetical protein